jgi:hypothetical protein
MANAIVVLNAGSSSIKFSLFLERDGTLEPDIRGQVEGLYTNPRFVSKAADGSLKAEKSWPGGVALGHDGALDHLIAHLRAELADDRLIGIGHRVVHGGLAYTQPVRVDAAVLEGPGDLRSAGPSASAPQSRADSPRAGTCSRSAPGGLLRHRLSPPSSPRWPRCSPCRPNCGRRGSCATGSTGCPTNTSPPCPRRPRPPKGKSSCCTWATARACAPWTPGAASPAPWGSRRSRGCPWAPAAARSIPA